MQHSHTPEGKDPVIWEQARKRASFNSHLATYVVVNLFLWAIWFFTTNDKREGLPWPIWSSLGWGLGLIFHYVGAYVRPRSSNVEEHYDKIMREKQR
jgi:hypothetical protein